jgi:hypothetical protein
MHSTNTQRGSILIYTMLTMTVMLGIGLTLTSLFISKLRSAAGARNATVALYTADSAVEMCLYEARAGVDDLPLDMANDAMFTVITADGSDTDITDDCSAVGSGSFAFRATGLFRGSSRTLEISQ